MKKLEDKVKKHECKAKRTLLRRQSVKLSKQAAKFRFDALKQGCLATEAGSKIYTKHHPVYEELILPLLEEAKKIALEYGFDIMFQTRTPIPGAENFTHGIVGIQGEPTPTMQACLDLIKARPVYDKVPPAVALEGGVHCTGHVDYDRPPEADPKASE